MSRSEKFYKEKGDYVYKTVYKFHKNSFGNDYLDKDEGLIIRHNNVNYQKLHDTESFYFGDQGMQINHSNKTVLISTNTNSQDMFSFKNYLKQFGKSRIINAGGYWICELSEPVNQLAQYEKIRFYFAKNNFGLYKQVFYTIGKQTIMDKNEKIFLNNPRLEIILHEDKFQLSYKKLLDKSSYYNLVNKKIALNKKIANYKLVAN